MQFSSFSFSCSILNFASIFPLEKFASIENDNAHTMHWPLQIRCIAIAIVESSATAMEPMKICKSKLNYRRCYQLHSTFISTWWCRQNRLQNGCQRLPLLSPNQSAGFGNELKKRTMRLQQCEMSFSDEERNRHSGNLCTNLFKWKYFI